MRPDLIFNNPRSLHVVEKRKCTPKSGYGNLSGGEYFGEQQPHYH